MTDCEDFYSLLKRYGFDFSVGVPCSILKGVISYLKADPEIPYIQATREEEAIGIAAGAYLAGKNTLILMQNSGLASCISALASLNLIYLIPVLLIVSWRGYRGKDAPEHLIMGRITPRILKETGIPTEVLSDGNAEEVISKSLTIIKGQAIPACILIRRGVLS